MLIDPLPIPLVVDTINEWSPTVRRVAQVSTAPTELAELASRYDISLATSIGSRELVRWADRLHAIFATDDVGSRLTDLNQAIVDVDPTPVVTARGAAWRVLTRDLVVPGAMVFALVEHSRGDPILERLGTCSAHRCADAYRDATQARSRRYCSLTCQNRAKAAARRARLRSR